MQSGVTGVVAAGHRAMLEGARVAAGVVAAVHRSRFGIRMMMVGADRAAVGAAAEAGGGRERDGESWQFEEKNREQAEPGGATARALCGQAEVCGHLGHL